jgi:hypothetical protein
VIRFLSNGRPIVARVCSRGNVFTESLPSNGSIRHNTYMKEISENTSYRKVWGALKRPVFSKTQLFLL